MSVYLDASVIVALFVEDALSARAQTKVANQADSLIVSDYAALEFSASVMRLARSGMIAAKDARAALVEFDSWVAAHCERPPTVAVDIVLANSLVRRDDTALRSADAVHVAMAQRLGAHLCTFDKKLAGSARRLGLAIA
ncbi:MAG: type II toxin-antitoxin system VapC family toxin [Hyphomonadaceae bacterium]|nr:type II toxin-antitoxin system VapC family toxin [Hyphomonadaceae bacterium]